MICVLDENQEKLAGGQSKDLIIYVLDEPRKTEGGGGSVFPRKKTKTETGLSFFVLG